MNDQDWKAGPKVVYARDPFPREYTKSIFLAGPTPRGKGNEGWRKEAIEILRKKGYDGVLFVPEPSDGNWAVDYDDQIEWEENGLHQADCILFWVPRDIKGTKLETCMQVRKQQLELDMEQQTGSK